MRAIAAIISTRIELIAPSIRRVNSSPLTLDKLLCQLSSALFLSSRIMVCTLIRGWLAKGSHSSMNAKPCLCAHMFMIVLQVNPMVGRRARCLGRF